MNVSSDVCNIYTNSDLPLQQKLERSKQQTAIHQIHKPIVLLSLHINKT